MTWSPVARKRAFHIALAAMFGLIIGGNAYLAAYLLYAGVPDLGQSAAFTESVLESLLYEIDAFHRERGRPPAQLAELSSVRQGRYLRDATGAIVDGWGHPIVYRRDGSDWVLLSYGLDGQPGGEGLATDLRFRDRAPPATLRQFVFDLPTSGVLWTCILTGVCSGLGMYSILRRSMRHELLSRFILTTLAALVVGLVMSVEHLPRTPEIYQVERH